MMPPSQAKDKNSKSLLERLNKNSLESSKGTRANYLKLSMKGTDTQRMTRSRKVTSVMKNSWVVYQVVLLVYLTDTQEASKICQLSEFLVLLQELCLQKN